MQGVLTMRSYGKRILLKPTYKTATPMDVFILSYGNAKEWYFNFLLNNTSTSCKINHFKEFQTAALKSLETLIPNEVEEIHDLFLLTRAIEGLKNNADYQEIRIECAYLFQDSEDLVRLVKSIPLGNEGPIHPTLFALWTHTVYMNEYRITLYPTNISSTIQEIFQSLSEKEEVLKTTDAILQEFKERNITPIASSIIEFSNPNYKTPGLTLEWWEDIIGKEVPQTRTAGLKIPILKPEISYTPTSSENPF